MNTVKSSYSKEPLSIQQQLTLLAERGLAISHPNFAVHCLRTVSYYRLSAYFDVFQTEKDSFRAGVSFEDIWKIYVFDRRLRLLVLDAIERIEVALRTAISNVMSTRYGSLWYLDKLLFNSKWFEVQRQQKKSLHQSFQEEIESICKRRKEESIKHFYEHYTAPAFPPSWMIIECLSLGTCENLYKYIQKIKDKKAISEVFGYHPTVIESTLSALRYTRNLCAHHSRLWNRWFVFTPKHVHAFGQLGCRPRSFYEQAFVLAKLHYAIAPQSGWKQRLYELFESSPTLPFQMMGFKADWKTDLFWESI